jgi:hypothetical protein
MAGGLLTACLLSGAPAADKEVKEAIDAPVNEADVKKAIDKGVAYLKDAQAKDGSWGGSREGKLTASAGYRAGITALAGLALLEAGVSPKEDTIKNAADNLRGSVPELTWTHSVAATILFLDRLEEKDDVPLIKTLTVRLLAGQSTDGGWGYECPKIAVDTVAKWSKPDDYTKGIAKALKDLNTEALKQPGVGRLMPGQGVFVAGMTENSCSEFAVMGLWIGRRIGVPAHAAMSKFESYCRKSQNADGTFPYSTALRGFNNGHGSPCMTCAGLLGLVHCFAAANESTLLKYAKSKEPPKLAPGKGLRDIATEPAMKKGLAALEASFAPAPVPAKPGVPVPDTWSPNGLWFYMGLWSIERVGMAYGREKLVKLDWYNWGARLLLKHQEKDGSWAAGAAKMSITGADLNTAFALLFLRKADLTSDLSLVNKGVLPPPKLATTADGEK